MNENKFPRTQWRVVRTAPANGAWNMAVDEAILETVGKGFVLPTLRLYEWHPPCLSLGYAQSIADVDLHRLKSFGWEIVRRPTGGRAILHTDELTYSVIGPESDPRLSGNVLECYQRLSKALLRALQIPSIQAHIRERPSNQDSRDPSPPICFEVPSHFEITVQGKKLIGSAQARRKEGVLQHGSLPLHGDLSRITQALVFPNEALRHQAASRLLERATTVEAILGDRVSFEEVAQAFTCAFAQTLNLDLIPMDLTPQELERAHKLIDEKYNHPSWTYRI